ncbi:MAG TPA: hypothetical protein VFE14_05200 [Micromonosporaceae bacterium]|nr:hypothetical protein [Micromonosporaceae bacterium]
MRTVKAAAQDTVVAAYAREATVTAALLAGVPVARPRWTTTVSAWYALDRRPPALAAVAARGAGRHAPRMGARPLPEAERTALG